MENFCCSFSKCSEQFETEFRTRQWSCFRCTLSKYAYHVYLKGYSFFGFSSISVWLNSKFIGKGLVEKFERKYILFSKKLSYQIKKLINKWVNWLVLVSLKTALLTSFLEKYAKFADRSSYRTSQTKCSCVLLRTLKYNQYWVKQACVWETFQKNFSWNWTSKFFEGTKSLMYLIVYFFNSR